MSEKLDRLREAQGRRDNVTAAIKTIEDLIRGVEGGRIGTYPYVHSVSRPQCGVEPLNQYHKNLICDGLKVQLVSQQVKRDIIDTEIEGMLK